MIGKKRNVIHRWYRQYIVAAVTMLVAAPSLSAANITLTDTTYKQLLLSLYRAKYVDQEISGLPEEPSMQEVERAYYGRLQKTRTAPMGYRAYRINFGYTRQENMHNDTPTERRRVEIKLRRQTLNFGEFYLRGEFNHKKDHTQQEEVLRGKNATLQQNRLPLWGNTLMDNHFGIVRTRQSRLFSGAQYLGLSSGDVYGVNTHIYGSTYHIGMFSGNTGKYDSVQNFERNKTRLQGLAISKLFGTHWHAAMQAWREQPDDADANADTTAEKKAVGLALQYGQSAQQSIRLVAVQGKHEEQTNYLGSLSARWADSVYSHSFGLYRLDPEVHWAGKKVSGDKEGAYYRLSFTAPQYRLYGSAHYQRNDISEATTRRYEYSLLSGLQYRIDQKNNLGIHLDYGYQEKENRRRSGIRLQYHHTYDNGDTGQWQLSFKNVRSDQQQGDQDRLLSYAHHWFWGTYSLSAEGQILHSLNKNSGKSTQSTAIGLGVERDWDNGHFYLNSYYHDEDTAKEGTKRLQVSLGAHWLLSRRWSANIFANYQRPEQNTETDETEEYRSYGANLTYHYAGGRPYRSRGGGKIRGKIFYDENRDGRHQPSEQVASGVTVLLDKRHSVRTDANGYFEFTLVKPGKHIVEVEVTDIPLPWALRERDERIEIKVSARSARQLNIPLAKLSEIGF